MVLTNYDGEEIPIDDYQLACLWPWDILSAMWEAGTFLQWVSDDPNTASDRVEEYWQHCRHLEFFEQLNLDPNQYRTTVPLFFHGDGVKIYKAQKAWVYSFASSCRKGASLKTKIVLTVVRENIVVKDSAHDKIAEHIGYMVDTLMTGRFPERDPYGNEFAVGSVERARVGQHFAGGWCLAFSAFKGDLEARHLLHKSVRFYGATYICEHCLASREKAFSFGDFRMTARCLSVRFTHAQYVILNGEKQSGWRHVRGWTKDRNLEDSFLNY